MGAKPASALCLAVLYLAFQSNILPSELSNPFDRVRRHLAGQVSQEWQETGDGDVDRRALLTSLAKEIIPYHMSHNAEAEACDLMMEIELLDLAMEYVDEQAYPRVCLYLTRWGFVWFVELCVCVQKGVCVFLSERK